MGVFNGFATFQRAAAHPKFHEWWSHGKLGQGEIEPSRQQLPTATANLDGERRMQKNQGKFERAPEKVSHMR